MHETFDPRVTPWQIDVSEFEEIESMRLPVDQMTPRRTVNSVIAQTDHS